MQTAVVASPLSAQLQQQQPTVKTTIVNLNSIHPNGTATGTTFLHQDHIHDPKNSVGTGGGAFATDCFNFIQNYNPPQPPCTLTNAESIIAYNRSTDDDGDDDDDIEHDYKNARAPNTAWKPTDSDEEATHYSSLYINNQELAERAGYLPQSHSQVPTHDGLNKYRTMSVVPPALPMRNTSDPSIQVNFGGGGITLGRHQQLPHHHHHHHQHQPHVYTKSDQNINTNHKTISNTHSLNSSSCTANRRKNH